MATMYDRLGELLNETLENGEIKYIRIDEKGNIDQENEFEQSNDKKDEPQVDTTTKQTEQKADKLNEKATDSPKHRYIYKKLTPEIERCYHLLDITVSATKEDIKKAYKEKIKYYHPDRHVDNPILQKVATDKTRQIVEAYKMINEFLNK